MDLDRGYWKESVIRMFFDDKSVKEIPAAISLPSSNGGEDMLKWIPDSKGIFSVRSAYQCDQGSSFILKR